MTYDRASCLYRGTPMQKNSETGKITYAMLYLQDVQSSLEIRGDISEEMYGNIKRTKFFKDTSEWLEKTGEKLIQLRDDLNKKQKQKGFDY